MMKRFANIEVHTKRRTTMHMVTVTYAIQPEKKEEMRALLHDQAAAQEALSLLMQIPGVTGYYSLLKPDADEGIVLYLYATEAQAQAAPTTPNTNPLLRRRIVIDS